MNKCQNCGTNAVLEETNIYFVDPLDTVLK